MKQKFFFLLTLLCISFISCNENESLLPYSHVYLDLNLTFRDKALKDALGHKTYIIKGKDYVNGKEYAGYGGVLVINTILNGLCAFDLSCPSEAQSNIRVEVDDTGLSATCPVCGTIYEVGDNGTGAAKNAKLRLTKYFVTARGNNRFVVSN